MNDNTSYMAMAILKDRPIIPTIGRMDGKITADEIINIVCDHFDLDKKKVISRDRHQELAECRFICMLFLRKVKRLAFKHIAAMLGNRDHTTIIHGINHLEDLMKNEESIRSDVNAIKSKIRSKMVWGQK